MPLCGAYLYCATQSSVFRECVWYDCTNVKETSYRRDICPYLSVQKLTVYQQSCTEGLYSVTIWMTLTLRGLRCKVLQFLAIMSIIERRLCWIFDSRYVEIRRKILQETEILTICQFIRQIAHIHGKLKKRLTVYRDIWICLGSFAESDLYKLNVTRFSSL